MSYSSAPRDKRLQGSAGRPKSEEKRQAILAAAGRLFLTLGLQGTSMDAVSREAGVSKQTVYAHFSNKDELFRACIEAKLASYGCAEGWLPDGAGQGTPQGARQGAVAGGSAAATDAGGSESPRRTLRRVIEGFMKLMCDPDVVAMHRVVASESAGYPQVASLFFESGPVAVKSAIGQCLERLVADGALVIPDIEYASWLLSNMALGNFHVRLQLGLIDKVPAGELDAHLTQVAEDFVQLYRADGAAEVQPGANRVETTAPVAGS